MEYFLLIITAILLGTAIGFGVWWYRFTIKVLNDFHRILQNEVVVFVQTYLTKTFLKKFFDTLKFIKWKKEKLPELQERTRYGDKAALTERLVKSKHMREENER